MHILALLSLLIFTSAAPAPIPQDIEFDLVQALPNPTSSVATGVTAQIVTYDASAIISAAEPQITVDVKSLAAALSTSGVLERRKACDPQPTGAKNAPTVSTDTPAAFTDNPAFSSIAVNAPTPTGYVQRFQNLKASNNAYGYLGFTTLDSYDTNLCARKCTAIKGCSSFNIYFERDPSLDPAPACANPPSYTMIKCVFWGSPISTENAVNSGQWRNQFQVVIAGSNGYGSGFATPPGYNTPVALNGAINAPFDSMGWDPYMGVALFNSGPFDLKLCADACTLKSQYALAHPPGDGSPAVTCQFFNTYLIYINNTQNPQGQYCAMYSESWGASYATNTGQWRGADQYIVKYSYAVSNSTNPGSACKDCAVSQASKDISWHSLKPYCSTALGVNSPATTTTTVTSVQTPTITNAVTIKVTQTASPMKKRQDVPRTALPVFPMRSAGIKGNVPILISNSTSVSANGTSDHGNTTVWRRQVQSVPDVLTKYPAAVVSSACSQQLGAIGSATATTVTTTVIATGPAVTITSNTTITTVITASSTTTGSSTTPSATDHGFLIKIASGPAAGQYIGKDPESTFDSYNLFTLVTSRSSAVTFSLDHDKNLYQDNDAPADAPETDQAWIIQGALSGGSWGGFGASPYGFTNGEDLECEIDKLDSSLDCRTPSNDHSTFGLCKEYSWMWMFRDEAQVNDFCPGGSGPLDLKVVWVY